VDSSAPLLPGSGPSGGPPHLHQPLTWGRSCSTAHTSVDALICRQPRPGMPRSGARRGGGKQGGRSKRRSQPIFADERIKEDGYLRAEIAEALCRPDDFPRACDELSAFLRVAHRRATKKLQRRMEEDTLLAFSRCLSLHRHQRAAAALCRQAVAVFPKQQSAQVEKSHKQLCISCRRALAKQGGGGGMDEEDETPCHIEEMPLEVLEHVLTVLPPMDLAMAMCVSRAWRQAACSSGPWKDLVAVTFRRPTQQQEIQLTESSSQPLAWHRLFNGMASSDPVAVHRWHHNRVACKGHLAWRPPYGRPPSGGYTPESSVGQHGEECPSPFKVARLALGDCLGSDSSSSSSDSDKEEEGEEEDGGGGRGQRPGRLWAAPSEALARVTL